MVLEITRLEVRPKQKEAFQLALAEAMSIFTSADGYVSHTVQRNVEKTNQYLLCIRWKSREYSSEDFKRSGRLARVRNLLHHFYEMFPETEYYEELSQLVESS
ncbi:antibiotic biosynthesis monooxygenase family protein [Crateriforma conspicua]|uniref:Antibiotic biosynthesis monooxygenase n=1 Tax=Crateriforma conspicua TaxID=2527996 RepID=A0A5C5Y6X6_9PLAN|nr:antibiotic biosynthesis monooxygenase family protein [Crateriforma conspicua]QDV65113.1 Antibiotic biosynthesis monooxygenase [Crateriforma conspicua]TWT70513.1 Antibiotic biosynthesis monooxygenase [Crateriforma conspicua]